MVMIDSIERSRRGVATRVFLFGGLAFLLTGCFDSDEPEQSLHVNPGHEYDAVGLEAAIEVDSAGAADVPDQRIELDGVTHAEWATEPEPPEWVKLVENADGSWEVDLNDVPKGDEATIELGLLLADQNGLTQRQDIQLEVVSLTDCQRDAEEDDIDDMDKNTDYYVRSGWEVQATSGDAEFDISVPSDDDEGTCWSVVLEEGSGTIARAD